MKALLVLAAFALFPSLAPCQSICTWFGDKSAAISLTYDDNSPCQLKYAIPEMNKRQLKGTFYIMAQNGFGILPDWNTFTLAINSGHEIGGHSLTHNPAAIEVKPTIDSLKKHMPGQTCFTWAYPAGDAQAYNEVAQRTIGARGWLTQGIENGTGTDLYNVKTLGDLCTKTDVFAAIAKRGWLIETIHCISSDDSPYECSLGPNFLLSGYKAHLDTLVAYRQLLWIGRFGDVVRYIRERSFGKITNVVSNAATYSFDLTDTLADSVYNYPLTLKMQLPTGWKGCTMVQGSRAEAVALKGDTAIFNAIPDGGKIVLTKTVVPASPFTISLWPETSPEGGASPAIKVYLPAEGKANGGAFVLCPGGGYIGLVTADEGEEPAAWLNTLGVAGIVLYYRLGRHPIPMEDVQRALQVVRAHAFEWGIDTNRIGVMGFSAGGHVASTAGTHFDDCRAKTGDIVDQLSCRPAFMMLLYPVVSFYLGWAPPSNIVGNPADPEIMNYLANDRYVTDKTPPTFLAHGATDPLVPPVNSYAFRDSCVAHSVPAELHIYPTPNHGFYFTQWAADGDAWMSRTGVYGNFSGMQSLEAFAVDTIVEQGSSTNILAITKYSDTSYDTTWRGCTFTSLDTAVASVSNNGSVAGKATGVAHIVVAKGAFVDTVLVTIIESTAFRTPLYHWSLDEITGTTVKDVSGNGNPATLQSAPSAGVGKFSNGLIFDGVDDYLSTNTQVSAPDVFTISLWFNTTATKGGILFGLGSSKTGSSADYDRILQIGSDGKVSFWCYPHMVVAIGSTASYNDGKWHHTALSMSPAGLKLYVDGVLVNTNVNGISGQAYSAYWRIGGGNGSFYSGQLDDIRLYDVALVSSDIGHLQTDTATWYLDDEPVAVAEVTPALDASPNPFNPSVSISVAGWKSGAELKIYSISGKLVADLTSALNSGSRGIGSHQVSWNAAGHASGVYVIVLKNGKTELKRKAMLIK